MDPFFDKIPSNKAERRRSTATSAAHAKKLTEEGIRNVETGYLYLDSNLVHRAGRQDFSYSLTFSNSVPHGETVDSYIIKHITPLVATTGLIAIDIGGPGRSVVKDLREIGTRPNNELAFGVRRSLGVVLEDVLPHLAEEDAQVSHTVLTGDLQTEKTEEEVDTWLAGEKAHLLFERMGGGLSHMPTDPYWMASKLNRWYGRLADGGIMFVQIPVVFNPLLSPWVMMLKKLGTLEVGFEIGVADGNPDAQSALVIRKLPGAPAMLPFLDAQTVRTIAVTTNTKWDSEKRKLDEHHKGDTNP